jgi:diguanylate cyclase (GGDEF)-like protein
MQSLVVLMSLLPINVRFTTGSRLWVETHRCVSLPFAATLLPALTRPTHTLLAIFSLHHVEGIFIGLSGVAISATLASFLATAGPKLPFRRSLLGLTTCTAAAGLFSLISASLASASHPILTGLAPLFGAILALLTAGLLPFLLPFLLARSWELESTTLAVRNTESRLLNTEIRLLAATENITDAFFLLQAIRAPAPAPKDSIEDFVFTFLNANAEKIINKPASEVLGSRITSVLPIDPNGRLLRQYREVVLTGVPLIHEFPLSEDDPDSPWMRHHVGRVSSSDPDDDRQGNSQQESQDCLAVTASDITERKHAELNLLRETQHDTLTGLPNLRLLDDRIEQAIARADRYQNRVALFLINLDRFRNVNEYYGRNLGDLALVAIAARLRRGVRTTDSVLRISGDEFIVLMPDMKLEIDIRRSAATLLAIIREPLDLADDLGVDASAPQISETSRRGVRVTASLGAAIYPDSAFTVDELISRADAALSRAKEQGGNQYQLYTPPFETGFALTPQTESPAEDTQS